MTTNPSRKGIFPAVLLGLSGLCFYIGYFAHSFVIETIVTKMYERGEGNLDEYAGYRGQSIQFAVFAVVCVLAPVIVNAISSKNSLITCSVLFSLFYAGFLHFNKYYFYVSQGMLGFAYGLFNGAEGAYLAEHSTERNIGLALSVETTLSHLGALGSAVALFIVKLLLPYFEHSEEYSDTHVQMLYGSYLAFGILSVVISCLLPKKQCADSLASKAKDKKKGLRQQLGAIYKVAVTPQMLLFVPASLHQGVIVAFGLSVFPTSFNFDSRLSSNAASLVVLFIFFAGIGIFLGGAILSAGSHLYKNFALTPAMMIHAVFLVLLYTGVYLACPSEVFFQHTTAQTILEPGVAYVVIMAVLLGIVDCAITTTRGCVCQRIFPDLRNEAYSATRLYQAISTAVLLFFSPQLTTEMWISIQGIFLVLTLICFFILITKWKSSSKISDANNGEIDGAEMKSSS